MDRSIARHLREHSANPLIKELNSIATEMKRTKIPKRIPEWPEQIKLGAFIVWLERTYRRKVRWKRKQGEVISVGRKSVTVKTGKYPEAISLVDIYTGDIRLI